MIITYMRCCKCKKYEESQEAGPGEEIRTMTSNGKIIYRKLPAAWNVIHSSAGDKMHEAVFCGDCLPNVLKEVFQ